MSKRLWICFVLLLSSPATFAHRLNEYLQATTISLSKDKISFELRLTPGTDVAAKILKVIDLNGDHQISPAEQQAYLIKVGHDLSLAIDGQAMKIKLVSAVFPKVEELNKGIGDVIIDYEANINGQVDSHQMIFKNHHYSTIAVYLVNCLLPADTSIHVTGQTRSNDQAVYQLNFTTGGVPAAATAAQLTKSDHWAAVKTYFIHGIKHILTGYDHLLFLCALVLGAASLWDLIKIVTAFTIAHSITLTLATFGLAHLPEQIVEPMIAASIVFVAVQNIRWPKQSNGNSRLVVAFFFGLFHGLGFAGGLLEIMHAMPVNLIWFAILGFSLGVEAGNQLVLVPLYGIIQLVKKPQTEISKSRLSFIKRYASGAVAIAGVYYLVIDLCACF